ncbi:MAG: energy transducer TonB [Verrucomicrobia bacterium]|nr:energy transducer TonB [Verrucomicrobiota bacterium]MDE3100362.1 energy transducer TonB [Verrucomicrobiota bacterium]
MNRLQKKCVMGTAGIHLLLLVTLLAGPAFFSRSAKPSDTHVLDVIPASLIDAALQSGVKNASAPAPAPPAPPLSQPQRTQPRVTAPAPPPPKPQPSLVSRLEHYFTPAPKPAAEPALRPQHARHQKERTQPQKIQISTQLVHRAPGTQSANPRDTRAVRSAITALRNRFSHEPKIDLAGSGSVAAADYASVVQSVYDAAWALPESIANDDENVKVLVTIARDGTVVSARIVTPCGDGPVDASVQRALDRVRFVAPFPQGVADAQRTYPIIFNPRLKKSE